MHRRTSLSLLILALLVGACGSDDDRPVDPERISLQIVSGDRQPARVADVAAASQIALPAGLSLQQLPDNLLPEPLVARIVVDGEPLTSRSSDPLGPSLATLPSDVVVTYRVVQPTGVGQRHCGDSFIGSAKPDANGEVTTYWERGTYAGECRMEVRLVVDGAPRVDTAFVVEFEPGAAAQIDSEHQGPIVIPVSPGGTFDGAVALTGGVDVHGNTIDAATVRATVPDSLVRWYLYGPGVAEYRGYMSADGIRHGWQVSIPDTWEASEGWLGLFVWHANGRPWTSVTIEPSHD